jgi:hypothetical protein
MTIIPARKNMVDQLIPDEDASSVEYQKFVVKILWRFSVSLTADIL